MLRRRVLFLISFLFMGCVAFVISWGGSSSAFALGITGEPKTVLEVDAGACWASEGQSRAPSSSWKIASFNDGRAFSIDAFRVKQELMPRLKGEIRRLGITSLATTEYQVHLHCSSAGHILMLNFGDADVPMCVHTDGAFQTLGIYPHFEGGHGPCFGQEALSLLLVPKVDANSQALAKTLQGPEFADLVAEVRWMPSVLHVILRREHRFHEDQARQRLLSHATVGPLLEAIDYNRLSLISGSSLYLFSAESDGF